MSRIIPLTGPESTRLAWLAAAKALANEIHTTNDQSRTWIYTESDEDVLVGPVYHGDKASESAMILTYQAGRGCWPMDVCRRTDIGSGTLYICIAGNGLQPEDWVPLSGGGGGGGSGGVQNKSALTSLTGGGATALDGQEADETNIGELWEIFIADITIGPNRGLQTWRVENIGSAATDLDPAAGTPQIIRAANYATTTNEIGFVRRR